MTTPGSGRKAYRGQEITHGILQGLPPALFKFYGLSKNAHGGTTISALIRQNIRREGHDQYGEWIFRCHESWWFWALFERRTRKLNSWHRRTASKIRAGTGEILFDGQNDWKYMKPKRWRNQLRVSWAHIEWRRPWAETRSSLPRQISSRR